MGRRRGRGLQREAGRRGSELRREVAPRKDTPPGKGPGAWSAEALCPSHKELPYFPRGTSTHSGTALALVFRPVGEQQHIRVPSIEGASLPCLPALCALRPTSRETRAVELLCWTNLGLRVTPAVILRLPNPVPGLSTPHQESSSCLHRLSLPTSIFPFVCFPLA